MLNVFKHILFLAVLFFGSFAFGSSAVGGDPHAIPWRTIAWQAFNVSVVFGLLAYFLKDKIVSSFTARGELFQKALVAAKKAREEAEAYNREVKERLRKLEEGEAATVARAQKEADEMRLKNVAEAKALAERIESDAKKMIEVEMSRAKDLLRDEVVTLSVQSAREAMKAAASDADHKTLVKDFQDKLKVMN